VRNIIKEWVFLPSGKKIEDISEELKNNIMEFINAPPIEYNKPIIQSHPQAHYASRLLPFTSSKLNETLESQLLDLNITDKDLKSSGIVQKNNFNNFAQLFYMN
jgi:hypothetical protein